MIATLYRVHRNLRSHKWVITAQRKRVSDADAVTLRCVRFVVSEKRRQAVIRQQAREVHAWAEGTLDTRAEVPPADARRGTYNPYRAGTFTDCETGRPITGAAVVWFTTDGMFYRLHGAA